MKGLTAIKALNDRIQILDQRILPHCTAYLDCTRGEEVVEAIRTLSVRGAPAIGVAAAYALWLYAREHQNLPDFAERLKSSAYSLRNARPTAVNLSWAVDRCMDHIKGLSGPAAVERLLHLAQEMERQDILSNHRIGQLGASLIPRNAQVLTHCNTGSLATIEYGTALGVIREAFQAGRIKIVWVDETRPLLQGSRLTAFELDEDKIPARLITDNTAGWLMANGQVTAVVVGADRIAANGDTANKIGTYSLAVLARHHNIPFYVAAPVSTIDRTLLNGNEIPIEERHADEVRKIQECLVAPTDFPVYNPAFDVTPGSLISAIVTDRGIIYPPYLEAIAKIMEEGSYA